MKDKIFYPKDMQFRSTKDVQRFARSLALFQKEVDENTMFGLLADEEIEYSEDHFSIFLRRNLIEVMNKHGVQPK